MKPSEETTIGLKAFIILFLLTVLTIDCRAQYRLAIKGDLVPYDSAVIVNLPVYRQESVKFVLADSLISQQSLEISRLKVEISLISAKCDVLESNNEAYSEVLMRQSGLNAEMQSTLNDLSLSMAKANRPKKLFNHPGFYAVLSVVSIFLIK